MPVDPSGTGLGAYVTSDMLTFGIACVVAAALVIFLDWVLLATRERSLLDISYGSGNRLIVLFGWALASGIVGLLSAAANILQPNVQAAVAVAVGWPLILTKLVQGGTATVQTTTEEVEEEA